jgi:hypothetical protein
MLNKLVTSMAAAVLAVAPIAAQAAPERVATPVAENEELGRGFLLPALIGIGLLIVIYLAIDSEEDPVSP